MHLDIGEFARRQTVWFLRHAPAKLSISAAIERYREGVAHLRAAPDHILGDFERNMLLEQIAMLGEHGIEKGLARRASNLEPLGAACDICEVADALGLPVDEVASAYFKVGAAFGLDRLRANAEMIASEDYWDRLAIAATLEDLLGQQRNLTRLALRKVPGGNGKTTLKDWLDAQSGTIGRAAQVVSEISASGPLTVAKLGYAARHLRSLFLQER
jgi:glutamate dehydrogenase